MLSDEQRQELYDRLYGQNDMDKALEEERQNKLASGLAMAGQQIGGAIGGSRPDLGALQSLESDASAPVKQLEQRRKQALEQIGAEKQFSEIGQLAQAENPESRKSTMVRDYLNKKMGLSIPEETSYSDIKEMMPIYERAMTRQEMAKEREMKREQTTGDKTQKAITDAQMALEKNPVVSKSREDIETAKDVKRLLTSGNPISEQMAKVKATELAGKMRIHPEIAKFYGGSQAFTSKLKDALEESATGRLTQENRKMLLDMADQVIQDKSSTINAEAKKRASYLSESTKIPPSEAYKHLMPEMATDGEEAAPDTSQYEPDVLAYAKKWNISPEDAAKKKAERMAKMQGGKL